MKKKVMIVGASELQVPIILKAKELGYEVATIDYNPKAAGIRFSDCYYNVSTVDEEGVLKATERFGADGIATVATDMPMRAISYTCAQLGLIGISEETAVNSTDKFVMIKKFEESAVPHPWFYYVKKDDGSLKKRLTYPCICKPIDNSASRGVTVIQDETEFEDCIKYSSCNGRSGGVIVEELLCGDEISVEVFVVEGEMHIIQVTDKITTGAPHFVEMGHTQPSKYKNQVNTIQEVAQKAVSAVGINNGPAHVEIMMTTAGPKLIELGARLGGDYISTDLVPLSTGVDLLGATIRYACGDSTDLKPRYDKASAIRFIKATKGNIANITGIEEARKVEGIIRISIEKGIGDTVEEISSSNDRIGYILAQADTRENVIYACEKALEMIRVEVE